MTETIELVNTGQVPSTKKVVAIDLDLNLGTFPSTTRAVNSSKKSIPLGSSNDGSKTQRGNLLKL